MSLLFGLLPATVLAVLGYVVLCCSIKVDGAAKAFGRILAIWTLVLAAIPVLVGAYVTVAGIHPFDRMMQHMSVQK